MKNNITMYETSPDGKRSIRKKKCAYCAKPTPVNRLTNDHIIPLSRIKRRGTGNNIARVCAKCNGAKANFLPFDSLWNRNEIRMAITHNVVRIILDRFSFWEIAPLEQP